MHPTLSVYAICAISWPLSRKNTAQTEELTNVNETKAPGLSGETDGKISFATIVLTDPLGNGKL